jgi:hypothetical protein
MSQGVEEVSGAVTAAGEAVGSSFEQGYGRAQTASSNFRNSAVADATAVAAATATWETAQGRLDAFQAAQAANPSNIRSIVGEFGGMPYVQTRDSGGPVVAGQSYLIGGGTAAPPAAATSRTFTSRSRSAPPTRSRARSPTPRST